MAKNTSPSLFAAGLNAHNQLDPSNNDTNVRTFHPVSPHENNPTLLFAGWSTTVLANPAKGVWSLGHQDLQLSSSGGELEPKGLKEGGSDICAFGDHEGLRGLLVLHHNKDDGQSSELYIAERIAATASTAAAAEVKARLTLHTTPSSPSVAHIAYAGNERVALTFTQAPRSRLCHVVEFADWAGFLAWYADPSGEGTYPDKHHMVPGRPRGLVAGTGTFGLLMEDGGVWSWGDARLGTLGRRIAVGEDGEGGGEAAAADRPGVVEALGGLKVVKVVSGGWLTAAVSEDGALYLWGALMPGSEKSIRCLTEAGPGEVVLVTLIPPGEEAEPLDVLDVAIGDNHVVAVASDHRLWVVGDNTNGQLGIDLEGCDFLEEWTVCPTATAVQRIFCGPKSTFYLGSTTTSREST